ncbi:hypothetical protein PHMEG_00041879, partial [Phytophthora megakarya]
MNISKTLTIITTIATAIYFIPVAANSLEAERR